MKECPECGYKPQPSDAKLRKLYAQHFPGMPILAMMRRKWIQVEKPHNLEAVLAELMRFSQCATVEEFKEKFGYEGDLMDIDYPGEAPQILLPTGNKLL